MPVPGCNWRWMEGLGSLGTERTFRQTFQVAGCPELHRLAKVPRSLSVRSPETDVPNLCAEVFFRISIIFVE
jgi:hypothetical protein